MRALVVVMVILLAGCTGPSNDAASGGTSADDAAFEGIETVATRDTGVIRGIVVDESIVPVAGASVQLAGTALNATTNDRGAFAFSALAPSTYLVKITKEGYRSEQVTQRVVAGEAEPDITYVTLVRIPGTEPYVEPVTWSGHIWCAYMLQSVQECDLLGTAGQDLSEAVIPIDRQPAFVQLELSWESTQQLGDNLQLFVCAKPRDGAVCGTFGLCRAIGASPLVCRVPMASGDGDYSMGIQDSGLGVDRDLQVHVAPYCTSCTGASVGLVVEQDFELFVHIFHNFTPPEDWQFSRDGSPTVPDA